MTLPSPDIEKTIKPTGWVVINCKDATNVSLDPAKRMEAALQAKTNLTTAAIYQVYGGPLDLSNMGKALDDPRVEAEKQGILERLRKDQDPSVVTAVNAVFPPQPTSVAAK